MTSLALQYGVPLRDLVNKFAHVRFEPAGFTGNQEIPIAKSIVDYVFRWLGSRFLPEDERAGLGLIDRGDTRTTGRAASAAGSGRAAASTSAARRTAAPPPGPRASRRVPARLRRIPRRAGPPPLPALRQVLPHRPGRRLPARFGSCQRNRRAERDRGRRLSRGERGRDRPGRERQPVVQRRHRDERRRRRRHHDARQHAPARRRSAGERSR